MASNKPVIHGRDHLPGHADAIWDTEAIRFDIPNVGTWLEIETTGAAGDGLGMHFVAAKPVTFTLGGSGSDGLFEVDADSATIDAQGTTAQLLLHSNLDGFLTADRTLTITGGVDNVAFAGTKVQASYGDLSLISTNGNAIVEAAAGAVWLQGQDVNLGGLGGAANGVTVTIILDTGVNLRILDDAAAPIFRVDESDGSVHILTGTTVQADL